MIRVLFLTESFYPVLGGGEEHTLRLSTRLAADGGRTTVVTRRTKAEWAARETLEDVRIVRVAPSGSSRRGKYGMLPFAAAAAFREMGRHDLLVVRGTRVLGLPGLLAARARGKPVVLQAEVNGELSGEVYTWGTPLAGRWGGRLVHAAAALRNRWLLDANAFVAMSRLITDEFAAAPRCLRVFIRSAPAYAVSYPTRFKPATRPCSTALGKMACTKLSPVRMSGASTASPTA